MSQPVSSQPPLADCYDLAVIGGGINGVGIAADAAGRGLKVFLCEKDDLAQHTSSASSKLIHGGLRYSARQMGSPNTMRLQSFVK